MVPFRAVQRALADMAGDTISVGVRRISPGDIPLLDAAELAVVERAVEGRRAEFASGRVLLRQLLRTPHPILPGPTRAPCFPDGVVGSLAHDRDLAVAAVSRAPDVCAIGIDIEPDEPLASDVARSILRDEEHGIDPHLAFTAKEAVYKAWSVLGGSILDHHDVAVSLRGTFFDAVVRSGWAVTGRCATVVGRHVALVVVRLGHTPLQTHDQS